MPKTPRGRNYLTLLYTGRTFSVFVEGFVIHFTLLDLQLYSNHLVLFLFFFFFWGGGGNIEVESNDGSHLESFDALGPGRRIFKKHRPSTEHLYFYNIIRCRSIYYNSVTFQVDRLRNKKVLFIPLNYHTNKMVRHFAILIFMLIDGSDEIGYWVLGLPP